MTGAELSGRSLLGAGVHPFDIQDVNLDYHRVLDPGTGAEPRDTMDVLLVAAKKEKIADYTGVISQAGRLAALGVSADGTLRCRTRMRPTMA